MKILKHTILTYILVFLISPSFAQSNGKISGNIKYNDGSPVPFANIFLEGTNMGTVSKEDGSYEISGIPSGQYQLTVSSLDIVGQTVSIAIAGGQNMQVDFTVEENTASLDEVVVSGQKRKVASITKSATELIDLPLSVQLVDQELLQQQQIIDVRDAVKNVSGVNATGTYGGGYATYNARGFNMSNVSSYRRNGMFIINMGHHFNDNMERVEILKGPASIQYGDIAPGAVMNFVTKKPLEHDYKRLEMKVGQYGLFRPTLDVSGSLNEDNSLLYRLNTTFESSQSFIDHVQHKSMMIAPSITWKVSPSLVWNVEMTVKDDDRVFNPGLVSPDGSLERLSELPISRFLGEPSNNYRFQDLGLYSELHFNISPNWQLRNTSYYTNTSRDNQNLYFPNRQTDEQGNLRRMTWIGQSYWRGWGNTLDLVGQLTTGSIRHNIVIGGDYMINNSYGTPPINVEADPINIFNPVYGTVTLPKAMGYDGMKENGSFIQRGGLYIQDQLFLWDERVIALLGLRFNHTQQGGIYTTDNPSPEGYQDDTKTPLSPRIGILVKPSQNLSLYASYTNSFEQNGWDRVHQIVLPETDADQVEFGIKSNLLDERIGVGLAFFQIDKKNVVGRVFNLTSEPTFPYLIYHPVHQSAIYQDAHHRSKGIELDINGKITPQLNVNLTASYIDAVIVEDPAFESGNQLLGNARENFSLWANYKMDRTKLKGLEFGYGFFYNGKFYTANDNLPHQETKAYWSMDASLGYNYKNFFTRLNVTNLTDNIGYLGSNGLYEPLWTRRAVLSVGVLLK
ncbi:TonB-dependent receptor [Arthrospiribacter ruber]|uniref:TonB-dependent siderophore receptor n=1 Tax=Arthrospiribacter ruber TaxID=2487934 RepID=A0A951MBP8_9BACT|nr:TonB-dependent receptor [Arthrospiribacter ruber]MBW3466977.1 TonB-dependent siderophore receptor [Arthrospiribacter ruber]